MFDGNLFDAQLFEAAQQAQAQESPQQAGVRRTPLFTTRRPRYWWEVEREELRKLRERS